VRGAFYFGRSGPGFGIPAALWGCKLAEPGPTSYRRENRRRSSQITPTSPVWLSLRRHYRVARTFVIPRNDEYGVPEVVFRVLP